MYVFFVFVCSLSHVSSWSVSKSMHARRPVHCTLTYVMSMISAFEKDHSEELSTREGHELHSTTIYDITFSSPTRSIVEHLVLSSRIWSPITSWMILEVTSLRRPSFSCTLYRTSLILSVRPTLTEISLPSTPVKHISRQHECRCERQCFFWHPLPQYAARPQYAHNFLPDLWHTWQGAKAMCFCVCMCLAIDVCTSENVADPWAIVAADQSIRSVASMIPTWSCWFKCVAHNI